MIPCVTKSRMPVVIDTLRSLCYLSRLMELEADRPVLEQGSRLTCPVWELVREKTGTGRSQGARSERGRGSLAVLNKLSPNTFFP